jgi:hypothetical protein
MFTKETIEIPQHEAYVLGDIVHNQPVVDLHNWNPSITSKEGPLKGWSYSCLHVLAKSLADEIAGFSRKKDISWKEALDTTHFKPLAIAAFDKEVKSLTEDHGVLRLIDKDDPLYDQASKEAIRGRPILDKKRDGRVKMRLVKIGFLEIKSGNETFTGHVVSPMAVRIAIASHKPDRKVAIVDVTTAFLQAGKFKNGKVKFLKVRNPITGEMMLFVQYGPLYGERSAPMAWENTIAPFIESLGFIRDKNDLCVFYHPTTDMIVLLYVDDIYMDGMSEDVDTFYDQLSTRFECQAIQILKEKEPLDYLGTEISMTKNKTLVLTMSAYTSKMIQYMNLDGDHHSTRPVDCPFRAHVVPKCDDDEDLTPDKRKVFMSGLGMLGWLVSCIRADCAYAYSMIASGMARPTKLMMDHLFWVTRYLKGTSTFGGITSSTSMSPDTSHTMWRHYCDSDQGAEQSPENKGKARCGQISMANNFPVVWKSKSTSVAMAHPRMKGGHADVSSGACEIYGAAQANFNILFLSYCSEAMGVEFNLPYTLEMDNAAAEVFANDTAMNTKLRHIDQRQHWVRALRDANLVRALHVGTKDNLADIFTKPLQGQDFRNIRNRILHDCREICFQGGIKVSTSTSK